MKTLVVTFLVLVLGTYLNTSEQPALVVDGPVTIHWYTIEEAMEANEKLPKKIFIDLYTDWCGWCKVMDTKTFTDDSVIEYMNEHFYAVKFNAEQKESITYKDKEYKYIARGSKGINELALELLEMQPSYPAFVVLDEHLDKLGLFKGYSQPEAFMLKVDAVLNR